MAQPNASNPDPSSPNQDHTSPCSPFDYGQASRPGATPTIPPPTTASADVLHSTRIYLDHWHRWCDLRLEDEIPADQPAHVCKTIQRLILCRGPNGGCARYVCPGCGDRRVPFSCRTRLCPSCGKVRVDSCLADIARDLFGVSHFHVTLTVDDLLWPIFHAHRSPLKVLLKTAAQAVRELVDELYPGVRIGLVHTLWRTPTPQPPCSSRAVVEGD